MTWLPRLLRPLSPAARRRAHPRPFGRKLCAELLEDRTVMSAWPTVALRQSAAVPHLSADQLGTTVYPTGMEQPLALADDVVGLLRSSGRGALPEGTRINLPDGKALLVANATLTRFNADGSPDGGFGDGGGVSLAVQPTAVHVQPDGTQPGRYGLLVDGLRYTDQGVLDGAFQNIEMGEALITDLVVQPDGKILVVGGAQFRPDEFDGHPYANRDPFRWRDFHVARFNADGTPDTTFGTIDPTTGQRTGHVTTDLGGEERADKILLQADGTILVVGSWAAHPYDSVVFVDLGVGVVRYTASGDVDPTFGTPGPSMYAPGRMTARLASNYDVENIITGESLVHGYYPEVVGVTQANGQFYAGISSFYFGGLVRVNGDGTLDATFNYNPFPPDHVLRHIPGLVTPAIANDDSWFFGAPAAGGLVVQPDGKILLAGVAGDADGSAMAVGRLNPDGSPDLSFGPHGGFVAAWGKNDLATEGQAMRLTLEGTDTLIATGYMYRRFEQNGQVVEEWGGAQATINLRDAHIARGIAIQLSAAGRPTDTFAWSVSGPDDFALPVDTALDQPTLQFIPNVVGDYAITVTATDELGSIKMVTRRFVVDPVTTQALQGLLPQEPGSPNGVTIQLQAGVLVDAREVVAAVNAMAPPAEPVEVIVDLAGGTYSGVLFAPTTDANGETKLNLIFTNGTIEGASPSVTLASGQVTLTDVTLTNETDAPTILVTGGRLVLRNNVIHEAADYNQAVLRITGGIVDLGTAGDPGGNTLNVNGAGEWIRNTGTNPMSAVGNTYLVDGAEVTTPVVGAISAPVDPVRTGLSISTTATFTDANPADTHTAVWSWGDGSSSSGTVSAAGGAGTATGSHAYSQPGVYTVTLTVTDSAGAVGQSTYRYVVAYDPSAGFVTGGGWINSPAGAYTANPALTGKANFGFVSRYQNGNNVPTGNTEFQLKVADFNFKSTSYEWLVVSGAKARFRGVGTVNGVGGYGFELTAWDGQAHGGGSADRFRIKVWQGSPGNVVYDNQLNADDGADPTTALGGGSIVIHRTGSPLRAAGGEMTGRKVEPLSLAQLQPTLAEALARWQDHGAATAALKGIDVRVADLGGDLLGLADGTTIWLDDDAAGHGWFLDPTPADDGEFTRKDDRAARRRIDLLSVLAHEVGHLLGREHDGGAMDDVLAVGTRQLPAAGGGTVTAAPVAGHEPVAQPARRPGRRVVRR